MVELRLYSESVLMELSKSGKDGRKELQRKLNMVKANEELTIEEKSKNIDMINFALNGGVHYTRDNILEDIKAGQSDLDCTE